MYIKLDAKRWYDKTNGNTYHSVKLLEVSGYGRNYKENLIAHEPFAYGYDDAYLQTAFKLLQNSDCALRYGLNKYHTFIRHISNNEKWVIDCTDVTRKKDL